VITSSSLYTLDAIKRILGIREGMLRAARRSGLVVYYKHGRGYVLGADWIAYVQSTIGPASSITREPKHDRCTNLADKERQ
jgi:hypothetical protein